MIKYITAEDAESFFTWAMVHLNTARHYLAARDLVNFVSNIAAAKYLAQEGNLLDEARKFRI